MKLCIKNVAKVGLLSASIALAGCSGSDGSSGIGGSGLVISGTLGGSSLMSLNKMSQKSSDVGAFDGVNMFAVEYNDLEVVATAATEPPVKVEAAVDASGNFSVDLGAAAKGTEVTITFVNEVTKAVVGEVKFTDSTETDLNGNPKADSAVVATDSLALGTINLSEDGTISIPKASMTNVEDAAPVSVSAAFDPTGEWTMAAYDGPLGTGFVTVGACDPMHGGPCIGMPLTLARFAGKDFTPDTGNCVKNASGTITSCPAASGTVGTADRYALSIWGGNYANSIGACGAKTGFSADEARGYGRIHITTLPTVGASGGVSFGAYVFNTASGFGGTGTAPYNQSWMPASATAQYEEADCRPMLVSGTTKMYNAWACRSKVYSGNWPGTEVTSGGPTIGWHVGLQGGGCFDSITNKPINVTNWEQIGTPTSYEPPVSATAIGAGFFTHEQRYSGVDPDGASGTATTTNITCKHTGGQFTDSSGSPSASVLNLPDGQYLGKPETILAYGAACSSAGNSTNAAILAGYRCYASNYWQNGGGNFADGTCGRDYQFDWQATDPANFIRKDDFKGRPKNAFITNILNYASDGQSAILEDEENESITIPTSANGSTFCKVVRRTILSFKKVSATKVKVELKESGRMASTDAACVAAANAAVTSTQESHLSESLEGMRMIFYINKQ